MREPLVVGHPWIVLAVATLATVGGAWGATQIEAEVDFTQFVPDHPGLAPYQTMLQELDGVRFTAVYLAHDERSRVDSLRDEAGFDSLVYEQQRLTRHLEVHFPGAFSHQLSVYEAMRSGHYMFKKTVTAGNPSEDDYSLPDDPATWDQVRQRILDGDGDDVLAADGSSALMLLFFATEDNGVARDLSGEVDAAVKTWSRDHGGDHPVTHDHQTSGLLYASHYTDTLNRQQTIWWGVVAAGGAALALLWVVRRPDNGLIATVSLGMALVWTYGLLGFAGYRLSLLTLFLAPLVIGIGVDHAVHVLHRYEEERDRGMDKRDALGRSVRRTGTAVTVAAATTVAGLIILLFVPARTFAETGGVAALGLAFGFLAAMTVTPALRRVLPHRHLRQRRDRVGPWLARFAVGVRRRRPAVLAGILAAILVAGAIAATWTTVESGSSENEFPQDDPVIVLQHRIEEEYGAFQRAYLIVQGDLTDPTTLQAMHQATLDAATLPLHRDASAVTDLLIADHKTDQGAADIGTQALLEAVGQQPSDEARLPQTATEARQRLDRLFADPLWRTIAPFTITGDYDLAVVAIQLDPWQDQEDLRSLTDALQEQAERLQAVVGPDQEVHAAGSPVNRAAVLERTWPDVGIATLGAAAAVTGLLALAWRHRGGPGLRMAVAGGAIILVAALLLLATIPVLDGAYQFLHERFDRPANSAVLGGMFLLAFAVTVAAGVDDWVHIVHRYWEASDRGLSHDDAVAESFRHAGRAITGTTLTTAVAFGLLAGVYFLQSKNLAILTAVGVLYAYLLTLLLAPLLLQSRAPHGSGRHGSP